MGSSIKTGLLFLKSPIGSTDSFTASQTFAPKIVRFILLICHSIRFTKLFSFYNNEINSYYKILQKDDDFQLVMPNGRLNLVLLQKNKFRIWEAGTTDITFKYAKDKITGFTLNHVRVKNLLFNKVSN